MEDTELAFPSLTLSPEAQKVLDSVQKMEDEYKTIYAAWRFKKPFDYLEAIAHKKGLPSNAKQEQFRFSKAKVRALIAGNRSGKSEIGAIAFLDIILDAVQSGFVWVFCPTSKLQKTGVQEKILDYLKPEMIEKIRWLEEGVTVEWIRVRNKRGHQITIEFKNYEQSPDNLQSAKLLAVWFDEEPPEKIYKEVYIRTIDYQAPIIMTYAPLKGHTWSFEQIFKRKGQDGVEIFNWGMRDNPLIPAKEIAMLLRTLSPREARMRLDGEYQSPQGMVYTNWSRNTHIMKCDYRPDLPTYVSVDWGITTCAIGWFQIEKIIDKKTDHIIEKFYLIDYEELHLFNYRMIMQTILTRSAKDGTGYEYTDYYCDIAGNQRGQATGHSIMKIIETEYKIKFKAMRGTIMEGVNLVDSYIMNEAGLIRFFMNEGLDAAYKAMEGYVWDEVDGVPTGAPLKDGVNDHFNDMVRYFFMNYLRMGRNTWKQT